MEQRSQSSSASETSPVLIAHCLGQYGGRSCLPSAGSLSPASCRGAVGSLLSARYAPQWLHSGGDTRLHTKLSAAAAAAGRAGGNSFVANYRQRRGTCCASGLSGKLSASAAAASNGAGDDGDEELGNVWTQKVTTPSAALRNGNVV